MHRQVRERRVGDASEHRNAGRARDACSIEALVHEVDPGRHPQTDAGGRHIGEHYVGSEVQRVQEFTDIPVLVVPA